MKYKHSNRDLLSLILMFTFVITSILFFVSTEGSYMIKYDMNNPWSPTTEGIMMIFIIGTPIILGIFDLYFIIYYIANNKDVLYTLNAVVNIIFGIPTGIILISNLGPIVKLLFMFIGIFTPIITLVFLFEK